MKNSYARGKYLQSAGGWKLPFLLILAIGTACVAVPYDGPPAPAMGYDYGYAGPAVYPWYTGADVDIVGGYGHGWRGGYGGGWHGGGGRGWRR